MIIKNISQDDFLAHAAYWFETGTIPTKYFDWRPSEGGGDLGEAFVYEMAVFWHEIVVRHLDVAIDEAMSTAGLHESDCLHPLGSIRGPAGVPNGVWTPNLTRAQVDALVQSASRLAGRPVSAQELCPYNLVIEVGASQSFQEILQKIQTRYLAKFVPPLPVLFIPASIDIFVNGDRENFGLLSYPAPPMISLKLAVYRRALNRVQRLQEIEIGDVDEHGTALLNKPEAVLQLPARELWLGRSVPVQLQSPTLTLNVSKILPALRQMLNRFP